MIMFCLIGMIKVLVMLLICNLVDREFMFIKLIYVIDVIIFF